jgi:hypothetical protein
LLTGHTPVLKLRLKSLLVKPFSSWYTMYDSPASRQTGLDRVTLPSPRGEIVVEVVVDDEVLVSVLVDVEELVEVEDEVLVSAALAVVSELEVDVLVELEVDVLVKVSDTVLSPAVVDALFSVVGVC